MTDSPRHFLWQIFAAWLVNNIAWNHLQLVSCWGDLRLLWLFFPKYCSLPIPEEAFFLLLFSLFIQSFDVCQWQSGQLPKGLQLPIWVYLFLKIIFPNSVLWFPSHPIFLVAIRDCSFPSSIIYAPFAGKYGKYSFWDNSTENGRSFQKSVLLVSQTRMVLQFQYIWEHIPCHSNAFA